MAGRTPKNKDVYTLKPGERTKPLSGKREKYRYIYANQFNRNHPERPIRVVNEGEGVYRFERI